MSAYVTASYASTAKSREKIHKMAVRHGTNLSWLTRFLVDFALENVNYADIANAVKADPEARKRPAS